MSPGTVDRQVNATGAAKLCAEILDGLADGRRVDDRKHLGQVVLQQTEVQDLNPLVEEGEKDVLGQISALGRELRVRPQPPARPG